ncbi:MAG: TraK family protein [Duganella sp.]
MAKTDAETIDAWAGQRTVARREKNLVALLAVRGEIESGLAAGYTARTVWLYLYEKGRIPCKYGTFLKFVNLHIRQPLPAKVPVMPQEKKGPVFNPPEKLRGFYFNPIPCKEDLI